MALGMRRAVFSFVIEQTSFSRTVSYKYTKINTIIYLYKHMHKYGNAQGSIQSMGPVHEQPYQCFPAEDVTIKTDPVLREVESSLQQDVPLKSTRVVWNTKMSQQSETKIPPTALSMMQNHKLHFCHYETNHRKQADQQIRKKNWLISNWLSQPQHSCCVYILIISCDLIFIKPRRSWSHTVWYMGRTKTTPGQNLDCI